jgi:hypothetical protein
LPVVGPGLAKELSLVALAEDFRTFSSGAILLDASLKPAHPSTRLRHGAGYTENFRDWHTSRGGAIRPC